MLLSTNRYPVSPNQSGVFTKPVNVNKLFFLFSFPFLLLMWAIKICCKVDYSIQTRLYRVKGILASRQRLIQSQKRKQLMEALHCSKFTLKNAIAILLPCLLFYYEQFHHFNLTNKIISVDQHN